jgi:hypothetical protein
MTYHIKASDGSILASFSVVEASDASIAGGVASALSLAAGTTVSVHFVGGIYVVSYDDQLLSVEPA